MNAAYPLYLIPLLPLLGATVALLFGKRLGKNTVTFVTVGAVATSFLVAAKAVMTLAADLPPSGSLVDSFFSAPWIEAGDLKLQAGLALDRLSSVLVLIITGIGTLIHIYATAYMKDDEGYTRFFGYLNLFCGAMLILVLGDSLPVTFVGWEGVGVCSYLLIGFWFDKEQNAYAGRKAFVVNRIGDFGFLLGMFLLYTWTGTLKYAELGAHLDVLRTPIWLGQPVALWISVFVLIGATGKSAQLPLYGWLPDAMAGPTPVSALIHAATMVTAGVYVVSRMHSVFEAHPLALAIVAIVGALTALFAAIIGIAQRDFKKVLAYSTVSQLGFMFVGVGSYANGTSNYHGGVLHLMTHAFFKAGLFLGAGAVMHAMHHEGDIFKMGGLKKKLPHTRWTFLIYCLAIAGIVPLAGFWSKDAILAGIHHAVWPESSPQDAWIAAHLGGILYYILLATAACTAFYMFRLYFLVFEGEARYTAEDEHHYHWHELPAMSGVLWVLAAGSVLIGLLGIPNALGEGLDRFGHWLTPVVAEPSFATTETAAQFWGSAGIALLASALGIGLAYVLYGKGPAPSVKEIVRKMPPVYRLVYNKFGIDTVYDKIVPQGFRVTAVILWKAIDEVLIDGLLVNGTGWLVKQFGSATKRLQSGDMQRYLVGILAGGALSIFLASNWTVWSADRLDVQADGRDVRVVPVTQHAGHKRLQYRVAWEREDELSQPQAPSPMAHHYESSGEKKITVQVIDPRWGTTTVIHRMVNVE